MQAGLNIGASMLSLKKPPGAVKRHHHAGPEVKDHRKFFLDVPPQVVAAAGPPLVCTSTARALSEQKASRCTEISCCGK